MWKTFAGYNWNAWDFLFFLSFFYVFVYFSSFFNSIQQHRTSKSNEISFWSRTRSLLEQVAQTPGPSNQTILIHLFPSLHILFQVFFFPTLLSWEFYLFPFSSYPLHWSASWAQNLRVFFYSHRYFTLFATGNEEKKIKTTHANVNEK